MGKAFNKKHDTPWMTRTSLRPIKKKQTLWKKYQYCRNRTNKEMSENSKREARIEIKAAKMGYMKSAYLKISHPTAKLFGILSSQNVKLENLWEIW